jgi:hypothetical protein
MAKYRKKPVTIEAHRLTRDNHQWVANWIASGGFEVKHYSKPPMRAISGLSIVTLEGTMNADYDDYVIKGVNGEFYPCKPDIFHKTYDLVGETET